MSTDASRHLAMVETSGNQGYIFASNRQRESVGASELITRVGGDWLNAAMHGRADVQVVVAGSGKAILASADREALRGIVAGVTHRACEQAPGLNVTGALLPNPVNWRDVGAVARAIEHLHRLHGEARDALPDAAARLEQLPPVALCATSGLPAATLHALGDEPAETSEASLAKRRAAPQARPRIERELGVKLSRGSDELAERLTGGWLGVVHADGNGVGEIFVRFAEHVDARSGDELVARLRAFSDALDAAAKRALGRAIASVWPQAPDVYPLVLGGDDVTLLCDGRFAVDLAVEFVRQFEAATAQSAVLAGVASRALEARHLSASAGVAIVKPHFPFAVAAGLAEELTRSAKEVKEHARNRSAVDFHVLLDSTASALATIRTRLQVDGARLTARPLVVGKPLDADAWSRAHAWEAVERQARLIEQARPSADGADPPPREGAERAFSRAFLHELRAALALGPTLADARVAQLRHKHARVDELLENDSLFLDSGAGHPRVARLLDAMELATVRESP